MKEVVNAFVPVCVRIVTRSPCWPGGATLELATQRSDPACWAHPPVSGPKDAFVRKYTASGTVSWTSQFGTPGSDTATAVAVGPDGAVYVVGQLAGTTQPGATPFYAFVRKYAADGTEAWTQQFGAEGPSATTTAASVAVDSSGAAYVAGWVFGALPGQTAGGQDDAFVRKYDTNGVEVWARQTGGPGHDLATTVSVDAAGDIYVAGQREQT